MQIYITLQLRSLPLPPPSNSGGGRDITNPNNRHIARSALTAIAAVATIVAIGCQQAAIKASQLPPELRVAAKPNRDMINLASIASPGGGESRIDPGDLLELTIASGRNDETPDAVLTRVSDAGAADIPLVGPVQVAGLEPFEASRQVAQVSIDRGVYRQPHVTLEIKTKSVNRVTVLGAVANPGVHELPRASSDLVKALAMAGGMSEEAGTVVEIVRQPPAFGHMANNDAGGQTANSNIQQAAYQQPPQAQPKTERIDLAAVKPASADYRLGDRDIVMVLPRDKEMVYVSGLVSKPGQFELPARQELRMLDAIAMAGGLSSSVADKVLVIRHLPDRPEPVPIRASIAAAKRNGLENIVLGPGDVVSVEQTPATAVVDALMKLLRFSVGVAGSTRVF